MKVCDLMVGDLVLHDDKVIRVDAVHKRKIGYHKTKDRMTWLFDGQFQPIQLTPEILNKQEFLMQSKENLYVFCPICNDDIMIDLYEDGGDLTKDEYESEVGVQLQTFYPMPYPPALVIRANYVHQLQHILRLCKIDKEIVL